MTEKEDPEESFQQLKNYLHDNKDRRKTMFLAPSNKSSELGFEAAGDAGNMGNNTDRFHDTEIPSSYSSTLTPSGNTVITSTAIPPVYNTVSAANQH